jgi:aminodeoxyfutalosine deaminase
VRRLLLARWIVPVTRPPIEGGGVAIDGGRIVAVGPGRRLRSEHADAAVEDLGDAVVLPGLVNAHTHLELSQVRRQGSSAEFVPWLAGMIGGAAVPATERQVAAAVAEGIAQCRCFGVTCVGDITTQPQLTRPVLARSGLRGVSFGEIRAMGARRGLLEDRLQQAAAGMGIPPMIPGSSLRVGISPHAPYSVEVDGYRRCVAYSRTHEMPLATHLSESPDEEQFLRDQAGPLRRLWNALPWWDGRTPHFAGSPIEMAKAVGLLDLPAVLAHVNYGTDADLELLAAGRASVVYCPRTHAWFGHPPHRWRRMREKGIKVALGTDSCASSGNLDLLAEARLVRRLSPEVDAQTLLEMVTVNGARALGLEREIGSLEPGKAADLAVFACGGVEELLERVVETVTVVVSS